LTILFELKVGASGERFPPPCCHSACCFPYSAQHASPKKPHTGEKPIEDFIEVFGEKLARDGLESSFTTAQLQVVLRNMECLDKDHGCLRARLAHCPDHSSFVVGASAASNDLWS